MQILDVATEMRKPVGIAIGLLLMKGVPPLLQCGVKARNPANLQGGLEGGIWIERIVGGRSAGNHRQGMNLGTVEPAAGQDAELALQTEGHLGIVLSGKVQRKYLAFLLAAAEKASKPVVIHAVRCDSELDGELKNFSGRVLVHGFRGSEAKLLHHLELGRFVSFAPGAWREHCSLLKCRGLNNIGLETDDSQMNITDIYREAEQFSGVPQWENTCRENFLRFIG